MYNPVKEFKDKIVKAAALKAKIPTTQSSGVPRPPRNSGCEVNTKGNPQTNVTTRRGKEGESPTYWKYISGRGSR